MCEPEVAQAAALWIVSTLMWSVKYAPILNISSAFDNSGGSSLLGTIILNIV